MRPCWPSGRILKASCSDKTGIRGISLWGLCDILGSRVSWGCPQILQPTCPPAWVLWENPAPDTPGDGFRELLGGWVSPVYLPPPLLSLWENTERTQCYFLPLASLRKRDAHVGQWHWGKGRIQLWRLGHQIWEGEDQCILQLLSWVRNTDRPACSPFQAGAPLQHIIRYQSTCSFPLCHTSETFQPSASCLLAGCPPPLRQERKTHPGRSEQSRRRGHHQWC